MRARQGWASPGNDERGRGGVAGCGRPTGSGFPHGQITKQMPSPGCCPAFPGTTFCWERLLLIQVCPQKALGTDGILFTLWFSLNIRNAYLLGWVPSRKTECRTPSLCPSTHHNPCGGVESREKREEASPSSLPVASFWQIIGSL